MDPFDRTADAASEAMWEEMYNYTDYELDILCDEVPDDYLDPYGGEWDAWQAQWD